MLQCLKSFLFLILSVFALPLKAQLPTCTSPGLVYFHVGSDVYNYDPYQPVSAINPLLNTITVTGTGLAVCNNLNGAGPSPTFYTVSGNNFWYYNGTNWINTGHFVGNATAVNIAGGGNYIYALVGATGDVYQYDGTGPGTLLTTVTGFAGGGPFDLVADIFGNWYILKLTTGSGGPYLRKYDPSGNIIQAWTITGSPNTGSGGGFAIICDSIYVQSSNGFYKGYVGGTNINLMSSPNPVSAGTPGDMASCPAGTGAGAASIDTGYYCGSGPGIPVTVSGNGAVTWSVLSGNATINGTGNSVIITADTTSRILVTISGGQGICSNGNDTVTIIVPEASIWLPDKDTVLGCGVFIDSLLSAVNNASPGINYNYSWSPAGSILTGSNTATPVIAPTANTTYVLTVTTPASQGGCMWKDSTEVVVIDQSVITDFNFTIKYGCMEDTVIFQNLSSNGIHYEWKHGNLITDTAKDPFIIYKSQGVYPVKLVVRNGVCIDSIIKTVDTQHPLAASFTADRDSLCEGQTVNFTNTSIFAQNLGNAFQFERSLLPSDCKRSF